MTENLHNKSMTVMLIRDKLYFILYSIQRDYYKNLIMLCYAFILQFVWIVFFFWIPLSPVLFFFF